jgi:hypothetical protein
VLVEAPGEWPDDAPDHPYGLADHQGPEVDGVTTLLGGPRPVGEMVSAIVVDSDGVDLVARS